MNDYLMCALVLSPLITLLVLNELIERKKTKENEKLKKNIERYDKEGDNS